MVVFLTIFSPPAGQSFGGKSLTKASPALSCGHSRCFSTTFHKLAFECCRVSSFQGPQQVLHIARWSWQARTVWPVAVSKHLCDTRRKALRALLDLFQRSSGPCRQVIWFEILTLQVAWDSRKGSFDYATSLLGDLVFCVSQHYCVLDNQN